MGGQTTDHPFFIIGSVLIRLGTTTKIPTFCCHQLKRASPWRWCTCCVSIPTAQIRFRLLTRESHSFLLLHCYIKRMTSLVTAASSSVLRRMATLPSSSRAALRTLSPSRQNVLQPALYRFFSSYPPHEVVGLPSLSPVCLFGSKRETLVLETDSHISCLATCTNRDCEFDLSPISSSLGLFSCVRQWNPVLLLVGI